MSDTKRFVAQLIRLALIIAGILAGQQVLIRLPMVSAIQSLPQIGISGRELVTAFAYTAILVLLLTFAKNVEAVVVRTPGGFPWESLVAQSLILAGVVIAYGAFSTFATRLLGGNAWMYPLALLFLAMIPIIGIGQLLYEYFSDRLERWEG